MLYLLYYITPICTANKKNFRGSTPYLTNLLRPNLTYWNMPPLLDYLSRKAIDMKVESEGLSNHIAWTVLVVAPS